ncbi:MAG TPA: hypothetical protein VH573_02690 [Mycobacteriales bacterium]|jgi:hypothetical protein
MTVFLRRVPDGAARPAPLAPAVEQPIVRWIVAVAAVASLGYGFVLGSDDDSNGVTVAAALAVGVLLLVVALAGQLPSSLKVGDVELKLDQARADGVRDGAKLAAKAATGMSTADIEQAATQALGSIRDPDSLSRARTAVHASADVVRAAANTDPAVLPSQRESLLAELAKV